MLVTFTLRFSFLLFALLLTVSLSAQQQTPFSTVGNNLKGAVRRVCETVYVPVDEHDKVELEGLAFASMKEDFYSRSGRLTKLKSYDFKGNGTHTRRLKYDENGKVILSDHTKWIELQYDEKGNEIEERYISDTITHAYYGRQIYKYDTSGNMIDRVWYGNKDSLHIHNLYAYDSLNNRIWEGWFNGTGDLFMEVACKYNGNDMLQYDCHCVDNWPEPCDSYTFTYEYDRAGNWLKKTTYGKGKKVGIVIREIEYY